MHNPVGQRGLLGLGVILGIVATADSHAQGFGSFTQQASPTAVSARARAPFDPAGYWVALVTRDWRLRMVVPGKGEYDGIPINLAAKEFADAWNPATDVAADKQCEAYGGGIIMDVPERLQITWRDDNTLQVRTDSGMQTRELHFEPDPAQAYAQASWQGYSTAVWQTHYVPPPNVFRAEIQPPKPPPWGTIKVTTTRMLPGLIRKNGVPYSGQSSLVEYWEDQKGPTQAEYLIVSAVLTDPVYLRDGYYYTANFQREPNADKWDPTSCSLTSAP